METDLLPFLVFELLAVCTFPWRLGSHKTVLYDDIIECLVPLERLFDFLSFHSACTLPAFDRVSTRVISLFQASHKNHSA